jgi:hydrogenase/urease accessory protein HupE
VCIARRLALPTNLVVSPLSRLLALFHGQVFGAEKHKTNSLSCAYIGQPALNLVSSIVLMHLKGKKNAY